MNDYAHARRITPLVGGKVSICPTIRQPLMADWDFPSGTPWTAELVGIRYGNGEAEAIIEDDGQQRTVRIDTVQGFDPAASN